MPHLNLLNKIDVLSFIIQILKGNRPSLGMLDDYFNLSSVKELVNDLNADNENKLI
jgi:hypothetical protein